MIYPVSYFLWELVRMKLMDVFSLHCGETEEIGDNDHSY